jgi:hypothetical protein
MIFYNFILTVIYRLGDSVQVFQVRPADFHLWAHDGLFVKVCCRIKGTG